MAEKQHSIGRRLECTVCLRHYNLTDRVPKVLKSCLHSFCQSCITGLVKHGVVSCPECRTDTQLADIGVNFALKDVLETQCEACVNKPRSAKCHHCDQEVCAACLEIHSEKYYVSLVIEMSQFEDNIKAANDLAMDPTEIMTEKSCAMDTIEDIRKAIQYHRDEVNKLEQELEMKVEQMSEQNIDKHMKWKQKMETQISQDKQFIYASRTKLGVKYTKKCTMETMATMRKEYTKLAAELKTIQNNPPKLTKYTYKKPNTSTLPDLGKVECDLRTTAVDHYKSMVYKNMTGSKGSGPEQLNLPTGIAYTADRLFFTDQLNHRLKCYDHNLQLLYYVGKKGSGIDEFQNPTGVAVGPMDQVFVCDMNNHRVKLYNIYGEVLRTFGGKGTGNDGLQSPQGIAVHDGLVYICDRYNYRVKVTKPDGTFVQSIGSKGQGSGYFQGLPLYVAVTSDGRVLVSEQGKHTLNVFSLTGEPLECYPRSKPKSLTKLRSNGIAVDKSDNIIITDGGGFLVVLNNQGDFVCAIGSKDTQPGQLQGPADVVVSPNGNIYVCDYTNERVQMYGINQLRSTYLRY